MEVMALRWNLRRAKGLPHDLTSRHARQIGHTGAACQLRHTEVPQWRLLYGRRHGCRNPARQTPAHLRHLGSWLTSSAVTERLKIQDSAINKNGASADSTQPSTLQ